MLCMEGQRGWFTTALLQGMWWFSTIRRFDGIFSKILLKERDSQKILLQKLVDVLKKIYKSIVERDIIRFNEKNRYSSFLNMKFIYGMHLAACMQENEITEIVTENVRDLMIK